MFFIEQLIARIEEKKHWVYVMECNGSLIVKHDSTVKPRVLSHRDQWVPPSTVMHLVLYGLLVVHTPLNDLFLLLFVQLNYLQLLKRPTIWLFWIFLGLGGRIIISWLIPVLILTTTIHWPDLFHHENWKLLHIECRFSKPIVMAFVILVAKTMTANK